ncbi:AP endonuclease [Parathielavia hyrcaniae]|uniref:Apurinic-apyrimidinic endonuclease 1 n=1 Tax=Parathielavia hyrcaniae TaxID=113614 RepID=A0AAN6Q826_9PEZI|nr:AP endonuclease [Parathielavia hyrcaniae]
MVRQSARKAAQATTAKAASLTLVDQEVVSAEVVGSKVEGTRRNTSKRKSQLEDAENINLVEEETKKPATKKRKTASKQDAKDSMPLAARTAISSLKRAMYIGAHVSGAGGVQNSIQNATHIGANAFALFLKSQRKWASPPLADEAKTQFHAMLKQHSYDSHKHIVPHGSYLVNLAQADAAKATQAYDNFVDDLQRCEALGIRLYNFHPGSTGGATMESACARIAAQLNRAHAATASVVTLLENMCGSGNVVGSRFEELRDVIALVDDKSRVGVCLDTCHAFAAGYDLRTPEAFARTMAEFDRVVGLGYLRALHLNDSKAPFGSHRDLHANIGTGCLGLAAFHNIMDHEPLQGLPMVLETPIEEKGPDGKMVENKQIWADEIKLLESLIGMDVESAEFKEKAEALQAKGASERQKIQDQVDKKAEKDARKGTKEGKGKRKKKDEDSCDSCGDSD